MAITQEQVYKARVMDAEGAKIRLIASSIGLPGKVVKKILLGELDAGDVGISPPPKISSGDRSKYDGRNFSKISSGAGTSA